MDNVTTQLAVSLADVMRWLAETTAPTCCPDAPDDATPTPMFDRAHQALRDYADAAMVEATTTANQARAINRGSATTVAPIPSDAYECHQCRTTGVDEAGEPCLYCDGNGWRAAETTAPFNGLPTLLAALERLDRVRGLPVSVQEAWDNLDLSTVPAKFGGDAG